MQRCLTVLALLLLMVFVQPQPSTAVITFFDDFNDGNTDGWFSPTAYPYGYGNWFAENGVLVQTNGGDHYKFLVDTLPISHQSVETILSTNDPAGYGGVTLWYQDINNWVDVLIYPHSDVAGAVWVIERFDGTENVLAYPHAFDDFTRYDLRVDANSVAGTLAVNVNDTYLFTYSAMTDHRTGLSGVNSGNTAGYFDDFRLIAKPVPEPSTLLLVGAGLAGLVGLRRLRG